MRKRRHRGAGIVALAFVFAAACAGPSAPPASGPLRILVTNDDGIGAKGIAVLAEALRALGEVTVVAPENGRSGSSHGVTSEHPIRAKEGARGGMRWIAVDALPATCVRLAIERLLPARPDVVVSGINRGENLGTVTFYSATVGAAREAAFLGIPSIAVNLAASEEMDYGAAATVTAAVIRELGQNGIARGTFLNINVPALPQERLRGVRITRQDTRAPIDFFEKEALPDGSAIYKPHWEHLEPGAEGTDIWAVRNGYVSVSVFGFDQSAAAPPASARALKRLESLRIR
jgi:5'-nucleotidase